MIRRRPQLAIALFILLNLVGVGVWLLMRTSVAGPVLDGAVDESSGLVASRLHPGIWWTHNDSGGAAILYAVRADGSLVAQVRVRGARNVDWEDLTLDASGRIWIADIGNNRSNRNDLTLYAVPEPPLDGSGAVDVVETLPVHYPEQTGWPDPRRNFDAEALFADGDDLFILTKHRGDTQTVLYAVPPDGGALIRRSSFDVGGDPDNYGGRVTAADLSADGRFLAVLTYHAIFIFGRPDDGDWLSVPIGEIPLDQWLLRQCEAIAWVGPLLVVTNEAGRIFTFPAPLEGL